MIIKEEDFMLKPAQGAFFDLYYWKESKDKAGNDTSDYKIASYGISIPVAIKCIAAHRLNKKFKTDTVLTLKEYIKEWRESIEYIKQLFDEK